eukprot:COSAG01_NODE_3078_length_6628_cov_30.180885_2_plen_102_part_00
MAQTYRTLWRVLQLPSVQKLACLLVTCRAAFACADNVTNKKMIEYGMDKTLIAFTTSCLLPLAVAVPLITAKLLPSSHPLDIFLGSYVVRLLISVGGGAYY